MGEDFNTDSMLDMFLYESEQLLENLQNVSWTVDGEFGGDQLVNRVVNRQRALKVVRPSPV